MPTSVRFRPCNKNWKDTVFSCSPQQLIFTSFNHSDATDDDILLPLAESEEQTEANIFGKAILPRLLCFLFYVYFISCCISKSHLKYKTITISNKF